MMRFILGAVFILASGSCSAFAAEPLVPRELVATKQLPEGRYTSTGNYLFNLKVARWAERHIIRGSVRYTGYEYEFEVPVRRSDSDKGNLFTGSGNIKQLWKNGSVVCNYRMDLEFYAYENQNRQTVLYVRDYSPQSIYNSWAIDTKGCPPVPGGNVWFTSPNPYYSPFAGRTIASDGPVANELVLDRGAAVDLEPIAAWADAPKMKEESTLREGKFTGPGNYLSGVKIARWANRFLMTGYVSYGNHDYDFEVNLSPDKEAGANVFTGEGAIKQYWKNGTKVCRYHFKAEVHAYANEKGQQALFIRNYAPQSVYNKWDIDGQGCPPVGGQGYSWFTNPNAFLSALPPSPVTPKP